MKRRVMRKAFALPTILLASTLLMTVLVVTAAAATSISKSLNDQYYTRLAKEAAESGLTYGRYCWGQASGIATDEQWPVVGELHPDTDCFGAQQSGYSSSLTAGTTPDTNSSFTVKSVAYGSGAAAYVLDSTGTVQVLRSSGGVAHTYSVRLQQEVGVNLYGIASGNSTVCSIQAGQLYCWGKNTNGQVGNGTTQSPVTIPYHVGGLLEGKYVQYVATGVSHTCAVAGDTPDPSDGNQVYCWGDNSLGQFGNGTTNAGSTVPVPGGGPNSTWYVGCLPANPNCTPISARDHTCVIANPMPSSSHITKIEYCWGNDEWGQSGQMAVGDNNPPTVKTSRGVAIRTSDTKIINNVSSIGNVSGEFACAVSGALYCWGHNWFGELGNGTTSAARQPYATPVSGMGSGVTKVATNNSKACALKSARLYCWGGNGTTSTNIDYRLDSGPAVNTQWRVSTPTRIITSASAFYNKDITDFAITDWNTCVIMNYKVFCSGYNDQGQLGQGNTSGPAIGTATSPGQVRSANNMIRVQGALDGQKVTQITGGNNHFCALTESEAAYCWGDNTMGEMGNGTTDPGTEPKRVHIPVTAIY